MKIPLVSIITPSLNQGKTIERTIESVLYGQDYPHIEYIIVDGNSNDNTKDIIKKYEVKISNWISEPDNGPVEAIQKALKIANGDIISVISADDYFESNCIAEIVKIFEENNSVDILHANIRYINMERNEILICKPFKRTNKDIYKNIFKWPAIYVNTFFAKREIYTRADIWNLKYDIGCDYELFMNLLKLKAKFYYLDEIVLNHQAGGRSYNSNRGWHEIKDISIEYGCNKIKAYYYLISKILERMVNRILSKCGLKRLKKIIAKVLYSNISIITTVR